MPWKVFKTGEDGKARWCVHKLNEDDSKGELVKCFDSEMKANAQLKALYANVKEISGPFRDILAISELRGSYPNVPIGADVDYAALIAGDANPVFLTIPIGKSGVTSGNKRHYDEAFLTELERQTLAMKPVGLMGHLSPNERATAFPAEAVHWVGAIRDGDTLWGKGYIPPGPVRERIARYKASGKALATSIDAMAEQVWDESLQAYRISAATLRLGQIDLAPADRAGIPDLATIPMLTSEMESEHEPEIEQEPEMDKLQIINEMTPDDARLLPKSVREAVLSEVPIPPEVAVVQELRSALGVDDKADLNKLVRELQEAKEEQARAALESRITELASDKEKGIKVPQVRAIVVEMVKSRHPKDEAEAEAAYKEVAGSTAIIELLKNTVQTVMGPPQRTVVQPQNEGQQYFTYPKKEAQ